MARKDPNVILMLVLTLLPWLNNFRSLSKEIEILTVNPENMIGIAMIKLTLVKCVRYFYDSFLK